MAARLDLQDLYHISGGLSFVASSDASVLLKNFPRLLQNFFRRRWAIGNSFNNGFVLETVKGLNH